MTSELHILCVEDQEPDFLLIQRELKKLNTPFSLKWVTDRSTFSDALDEMEPDVILCDHNLPDFSSTEAFGIVRGRGLNVPFILVTAMISEDEGVKQINNGIDDYIFKDRLRRLPSAVTRVIKLRRAEVDRERYYHQLVAKERRFRAIVEQSHEAVVLCDSSLNVEYISPAFLDIFFPEEGSYEGKHLFELLSATDDGEFKLLCRQALRHEGQIFKYLRHVKVSERSFWLECTVTNLLKAEDIKSFVVNIRDVSERVTSETSLKRTQAIVSSIINNSQIAYVLVDPSFRVVTFNTRAEERYSYEFGKRLTEGTVIFDYLPERRKPQMREMYQKALDGENLKYEAEFPRNGKESNWYEINAFPIHEDDQSLLGIIVATEDITFTKLAEAEKDKMTADLITQNKNLEQFAFIVSHNLRAPVANILGFAELLNHTPDLSESDIMRCAAGMATSASNIDRVILDLHDILKKRRSLSENKQVVSFRELLLEIRQVLNTAISENHLEIKTGFEVKDYHCIRSYMHSIFLNLISNSIRYRKPDEQPQLRITSVERNKKLILEFSDNGLGIDLHLHGDKIFGLYQKFHLHGDGRGMGLYMVKTQCELMGGTINVKSTAGEGATFTLTFPF